MKPTLLLGLTLLVLVLPAYKVKSRMGINLIKDGQHTPDKLERLSRGWFKADWVDTNFIRRPW